MRRRVLSFLMALAMTAVLLAGCGARGNVAAESRNGVARVLSIYGNCTIYCIDVTSGRYEIYADGETLTATGSAFGVGAVGKETDIFVTNRHVVGSLEGELLGWVSDTVALVAEGRLTNVYLLKDDYAYSTSVGLDTSRAVPCRVIYEADENHADLAVLRASEPMEGRVALPLLKDDDSLDSGDTVYALGYPGSTDDASLDSEGNHDYAGSVESVTVTSGIVSLHTSFVDDNDTRVDIIQHTATINHGNSGGPLIDANGAVVGVNTWGYGQDLSSGDTGANGSIEVRYVRDILDDLDIDWTPYSSGPNLLVVGLIVLALLLAAAAAAVVLVLMTRNKRQAPVPVPVPAPGPGPAPAPAAPAGPEYRIQGISGVFAGRRFAVQDGVPIRIGTDPSANDLVFPAGTAGVSRRHCILTLQGGQLRLRDAGSTYGTIVGGQRLEGDQTMLLHTGDRFFLGSEQQCFMITVKGGM